MKAWRCGFRAGLELRVAKYLILRVFTVVYFWIFTTPLAKFLSLSNLQRESKSCGISDLLSASPVFGLALSTAGTEAMNKCQC